MVSLPQYQLFSYTTGIEQPGRWRFVLRCDDGTTPLEAEDSDPTARGERLELLCVVRGLEALDQPSRVVLMTPSVYVREGIRYGLEEWRQNDWQWESFGKMVPVKNLDLWQRVEQALQFHQVECRTWRIDAAHESVPAPHARHRHNNLASYSENRRGIKPRLQRIIDGAWPRIALVRKELERVACL